MLGWGGEGREEEKKSLGGGKVVAMLKLKRGKKDTEGKETEIRKKRKRGSR